MTGAEIDFPNALIRSTGVLQSFRNRGIAAHLFCTLVQSLKMKGISDLFLFSKDSFGYWKKKPCTIQALIDHLPDAPQVRRYVKNGSIWGDLAWHRNLWDAIHHRELQDSEFEKGFEAITLNPSLFTHEAHVRLAWCHLKKYGKEKAIENITVQLMRFTRNTNAEAKYNEAVTITSIEVIDRLMEKSATNAFDDFIAMYPRLLSDFRNVLKEYNPNLKI